MAKKKIKQSSKYSHGRSRFSCASHWSSHGQHGVNIMEFVTNTTKLLRTKRPSPRDLIYEDRTFTFVIKLPVSEMIKQELKLKLGSGVPNKTKVGKLTQAQLKDRTDKLPDLNTTSIESAMKSVAGTARSMGVDVEK